MTCFCFLQIVSWERGRTSSLTFHPHHERQQKPFIALSLSAPALIWSPDECGQSSCLLLPDYGDITRGQVYWYQWVPDKYLFAFNFLKLGFKKPSHWCWQVCLFILSGSTELILGYGQFVHSHNRFFCNVRMLIYAFRRVKKSKFISLSFLCELTQVRTKTLGKENKKKHVDFSCILMFSWKALVISELQNTSSSPRFLRQILISLLIKNLELP